MMNDDRHTRATGGHDELGGGHDEPGGGHDKPAADAAAAGPGASTRPGGPSAAARPEPRGAPAAGAPIPPPGAEHVELTVSWADVDAKTRLLGRYLRAALAADPARRVRVVWWLE